MWKMGACIALSAAMMLTSVGGMLPSDWGIETVYADETQTTTKTFTAEQLEVIWGNAKSKLEDSKWKLSFENQYDQVKWKVPEAIALSDVKSVTFHVADQKGSVTLKVYNGGDDAEAANTQYGLTGSEEYTIEPSGEGSVDAIGLMTTDETGSGSEVSLISVTFELKEGSGSPITYGENIIKDGDFASNGAAASWNASVGKSTITVATEENEIGDSDLKTYGVINRDPATATSGDCFLQTLWNLVKSISIRSGQNFRTYTKMHRKNSEMLILRRFMYPVEKQLILEVIRQAFFPEKLRKHIPQESGRSFPVHSMFRRPRIRL